MHIVAHKLRDFLAELGLVRRADLDSALEYALEEGIDLGEHLVAEGKLTPDALRQARAHVAGIHIVSLRDVTISFEALLAIPEPITRAYNIVAFKKDDVSLHVAMLDLEALRAIDFLKKTKFAHLRAIPYLTDVDSIKHAILEYQRGLKRTYGADLQKDPSHPSLFETLLRHALVQHASDIHIEPMQHHVLVRYRIGAYLHDAMVLPLTARETLPRAIKELAHIPLDTKGVPYDARFAIKLGEETMICRASLMHVHYGEKIVLRLFREPIAGFSFEGLGFHGEALEKLHRAIKYPEGLILVAGPTGAGKSTTLYTILDVISTPSLNISTIEDKIEYYMPRINQTQIHPAAGVTYAAGVRALMKQDSDVIMIGELDTDETLALALNATLMGRLVLSTSLATTVAEALIDLTDRDIDTLSVANNVRLVVVQRRVRKLNRLKGTIVQHYLTKKDIARIAKIADLDKVLTALQMEGVLTKDVTWDKIPFYTGSFAGETIVSEVLNMNQNIRDLVVKGAPAKAIYTQARTDGMLTLAEDALFKAVQGIIPVDEVFL